MGPIIPGDFSKPIVPIMKTKVAQAKQSDEVIPGAKIFTVIPINIKCLYGNDGNLTPNGQALQKQLKFEPVDNNTVLFHAEPNNDVPYYQRMKEPIEPYPIDKNKIEKINFTSVGEYEKESLFEITFLGKNPNSKDLVVIKRIYIGLGEDTRHKNK